VIIARPKGPEIILTVNKLTMIYQQVVNELIKIALTQHNVRSAGYGDIYNFMNTTPNIKYNVFYVTPAQMQSEEEFDRITLNLFHISRLENLEGDNILQLHSISKEVLDNVVKIFCEEFDTDTYGTTYYQMFNQRFQDLCCGCYMTVTLLIPKSLCIDE